MAKERGWGKTKFKGVKLKECKLTVHINNSVHWKERNMTANRNSHLSTVNHIHLSLLGAPFIGCTSSLTWLF